MAPPRTRKDADPALVGACPDATAGIVHQCRDVGAETIAVCSDSRPALLTVGAPCDTRITRDPEAAIAELRDRRDRDIVAQRGDPLIALASSPSAGSDIDMLVAATLDLQSHQLSVWRSADGGSNWSLWLRETSSWPSAHISLGREGDEGTIVCSGQVYWGRIGGTWRRVLETDRPIRRLVADDESVGALILTTTRLLRSSDGLNWTFDDEGLDEQVLMDLAVTRSTGSSPIACVLGVGGTVWRRQMEPEGAT